MIVTFIHGSLISTIVPGSGSFAGLSIAISPAWVMTRYSTDGEVAMRSTSYSRSSRS
jgi:hypothetical protein